MCASVCSYYAYEARNTTQAAKFSLKKFASIGIDSWIKQEVGELSTSVKLSPDVSELVQQTIRLNNELLQQKDMTIRLQQTVIESQKFLENTTRNSPGLKKMMIAAQDKQPVLGYRENGKPVRLTLLEWLAQEGYDLEDIDQSLYRKFRLNVGRTYESLKETKPPQEWRVSPKKEDGSGGNSIFSYVYTSEDFPMLKTIWEQTLSAHQESLIEMEMAGGFDDDLFN